MDVESVPNEGSVFNIQLTFARQEQATIPVKELPHILRNSRILVVDDNRKNLECLQSMLASFSFEVLSASSGDEAMKFLKSASPENPIQLAILDSDMPGMSGLEVVALLRKMSDYRELPVVLMTGLGKEPLDVQAKNLKVNAFITKPIKQSLLLDTIMEAFGHTSLAPQENEHYLVKEQEAKEKIRGSHLLLVEDNPINQKVAIEILKSMGLVVSVANNGLEALQKIEENSYDMVLMDVQMPEMDGYQATKVIRSNPAYQDLPILAMTAHAMKGDREKCLAAGMNDYLTKPIDPLHLVSALIRWIDPQKRETNLSVDQEIGVDAVSLPDALPGINLQCGLNRIGGNKKLFVTILKEFWLDYRESNKKIYRALKQNRKQDALRLTHTLKGVCGNFSAESLYQASLQLEKDLKTSQDRCMEPSSLHKFEDAFQEVLSSIQSLELFDREEKSEVPDQHLKLDIIRPILKRLAEYIEDCDFEADVCLNELEPYLEYSCLQKEFKALEADLNKFDFKNAKVSLSLLRKALNVKEKES